ncbi:MAG: peptidase S16 [Proteobacteria bacterium]|nr:MAG: peptidase S16 [Pseudomonadota bacterium]
MESTLQIPIFPLSTVLYPEGLLPLRVFEQRYLDMTKVCIRDNSVFGVCLIREGHEVGAPALPHEIGCTARINEWDMPHLGLFQLVAQGERVFRIQEHWVTKAGLIEAQVQLENPLQPEALPGEYAELAELLQKIMAKLGSDRFPSPIRLDDAAWVARRLAELLPLESEVKQRLLESREPVEGLSAVKAYLQSKQVVV